MAKLGIIVDMDLPNGATYEKIREIEVGGYKIYGDIMRTNGMGSPLSFTVSEAVGKSRIRLILAQMYVLGKVNLIPSGTYSGQIMSGQSMEAQKNIIYRSIYYTKACKPCNVTTVPDIPADGFFPPTFMDQDDNTFKALDALGQKYDCGFVEGDYIPTDHAFKCVAIGESNGYPLNMAYFKEMGLTPADFIRELKARMQLGTPVFIVIQGSMGYTEWFTQFMAWFKTVVSTTELIYAR